MENLPIVRFSHVSVRFPNALANDDVCLDIRRGEAFALVGENGAGKTTLMNALYGLLKPTLGEIFIKGKKITPHHDPMRAMAMGIGMVHQHFKLVPGFTVAQNIALGMEPLRRLLFYDQARVRREVLALRRTLRPAREPGRRGGRAERGPAAARGNLKSAAPRRGRAGAGRTHRRAFPRRVRRAVFGAARNREGQKHDRDFDHPQAARSAGVFRPRGRDEAGKACGHRKHGGNRRAPPGRDDGGARGAV